MPSGNGQAERVNRIIISVLAKLAYEKPDEWYKFVPDVQRYINCTYQRSIDQTPFELMFGVLMRSPQKLRVIETMQREFIGLFEEERSERRRRASQQISKVQQENKAGFDKRRREAHHYAIGDWVAIKRTQYGAGQKIGKKYMGPYKVIEVRENDRYDVVKADQTCEGPNKTSTGAENMKLFHTELLDESENEEVGDVTCDSGSDFCGFEEDEAERQPGRLYYRTAE